MNRFRNSGFWRRGMAALISAAGLVALLACSNNEAPDSPDWTSLGIPDGQWPTYGGGPYNQNFSPLTQINKDNVADLEVAWTFHYGTGAHEIGDAGLDFRFRIIDAFAVDARRCTGFEPSQAKTERLKT